MINNITVAWATPVDAYDLGARLEAFVECKGVISTFRICVKHARFDTPLSQLPPELIEIVAEYVRLPIFEQRRSEWQDCRWCCQNGCHPSSHLSNERISEIKIEWFDEDCELFDDRVLDFEDELQEEGIGYEEHHQRIENFLEKIDERSPPPNSTSPFQRCKEVKMVRLDLSHACADRLWQIFRQDFNLEIYFSIFHEYQGNELSGADGSPKIVVLAYLILPSVQSAIKASPGPNSVSTLSSMIVDPSTLQAPSAEEVSRFKKAMITMHLSPKVQALQITTLNPTSTRPATPKWRPSKEFSYKRRGPTECEKQARGVYSSS